MSWPPGEHAQLTASAEQAIAMLDTLVSHLVPGSDVDHVQHGEMADRARQLGALLRAAHNLALADSYPAAFAILRVALEHQLLDELVFRGRRLVQVFDGVTEEIWERWQRERADGAKWASNIVDWTRSRSGRVRVVRTGMQSEPDENGERIAISVYYFLLQQYQPLTAKPSDAMRPTQGFPHDPDSLIRHTKQNRDLYESYLRWASIKESLVSNGFEDAESIARIEVHYRFLSAYIHPLSNRMQDTYGRNRAWPSYDHFASELALLYILTFAARELRSFRIMSALPPVIGISDKPAYEAAVDGFDSAAAHLWFPGQPHHHYDEWASANHAEWVAYNEGKGQTEYPPALVYYSNPLKRLVSIHSSVNELSTGLAYISPWPRQDAWLR